MDARGSYRLMFNLTPEKELFKMCSVLFNFIMTIFSTLIDTVFLFRSG